MTWSRPQLIQLVRGSPEDAVLTTCKTDLAGQYPSGFYTGCNHLGDGGPACGPAAPTGHINAFLCQACSAPVSS